MKTTNRTSLNPTRLLVVGGSAAGPKAAARARRLDEHAEITILQKSPDLSMASCGYPYYVGKTFDDRNMLLCTPTGVVRDPAFYLAAKGIVARTNTEVVQIDREDRYVLARDVVSGEEQRLPYDKLVLATGAKARRPPIANLQLRGITTLQSMQDADYLRQIADKGHVKRAVIVGGGLIGIETCEALRLAGIEVTIVERLPQLLPFLDWQLARLVENHVRQRGVTVFTDCAVASCRGEDGVVKSVELADGTEIECQLVVLAIGVAPNVELAQRAGLKLGANGGIAVDDYMMTSDPNIFAAGDCVECRHLLTGQTVHAPYGDLANLQGRVAGENAILGPRAKFHGTFQTGICKIFDYSAGSTGLSADRARASGHREVVTVVNASPDKPAFMGSGLLVTKLVADGETGTILGAQCVGTGDVSKQIAIWATALKGRLTVQDMVDADLPYAPPFSLAIDHSIASAHIMQNKLDGRMRGVGAPELQRRLEAGERPFLLDLRGPDEYEQMRLGVGERLIPLGALRQRLDELPAKGDEIICFCKISLRGYEAARILSGLGWTNVSVLEGGIVSWPYPREK